jgi:hypothetical protein
VGQNLVRLADALIIPNAALSTTAFWFYDGLLTGSPHPHLGILFFPGILVLGLVPIPLGI